MNRACDEEQGQEDNEGVDHRVGVARGWVSPVLRWEAELRTSNRTVMDGVLYTIVGLRLTKIKSSK